MRKYLIWIIVNVVILSIGFFVGTQNERIYLEEVRTDFLGSFINDKTDLTKYQLEEKYSRYLDYIDIDFDTLYEETNPPTDKYIIHQRIFSYQVILVAEGSQPTQENLHFFVSRYLGNTLPYDYLFIGIIAIVNMIGVILMQSKKDYYVYTILDKVTFLSVIIMFFFMESDYGVNVYTLILAVHLLILIGHYIYVMIVGKRRYIIKSNQSENESIYYALKEDNVPVYLTQKQSLGGAYLQAVVTKDEEDGLFTFLDEHMKPKEMRYTVINLVALAILSGVVLYFFIINLW